MEAAINGHFTEWTHQGLLDEHEVLLQGLIFCHELSVVACQVIQLLLQRDNLFLKVRLV